MIINSQRTIYGLEYSGNSKIGLPHVARVNTTLNEKFGVQSGVPIPAGTDPYIKYMAIGTGGSNPTPGLGTYSYSNHSVTDAALFNHVPFIMRPVATDLTGAERARYRMRVVTAINGVDYAAYYLRVIAPTDITTDVFTIANAGTAGGSITPFTTDTAAYLNPTPLPVGRTPVGNGSYISKMIKIPFTLTPAELAEVTAAMALLYTTPPVTITEIGICGGCDQLSGTPPEALGVQIYYHVGVGIDITMKYDPILGYVRAIELGGCENLYA